VAGPAGFQDRGQDVERRCGEEREERANPEYNKVRKEQHLPRTGFRLRHPACIRGGHSLTIHSPMKDPAVTSGVCSVGDRRRIDSP